MVESETMTGYAVIIDSIGDASPAVSKVLADGLSLPVEVVLKALYNTPSVMFGNIDENIANDAVQMLNALGLQARKQPKDDPVPEAGEKVDIGIYIHDARYLPTVVTQLTEFLGCEAKEALALLANEPPLVLGGVSIATAEALSQRVSAEVVASNPETEQYAVEVIKDEQVLLHQFQAYLEHHNIEANLKESRTVEGLDYKISDEIWRKFQSTGMVKLHNRGFQRFEVILNSVDTENENYKKALTEMVGMPEQIIDKVLANLPIQLHESLNRADLTEKLEAYSEAGLKCSANEVKPGKYKLIVESMKDLDKTRSILSQFVAEKELPKSTQRWVSPVALGDLLTRYASEQLKSIECEIDYEQVQ